MKFLIDANLPRSSAALLQSHGLAAMDVRDVLPGGSDDDSVAAFARAHNLALITRDFDFADIRNYPPEMYSGILVLELPDDATATQLNQVLDPFLRNPDFLNRLHGRLAVASSWRVRFRPM